jgi:hypothetical protein
LSGAVAFCLSFLLFNHAMASKLSDVTVESVGFGATQADAVQDALVNAIAQVNGEAIAASTKLRESSSASVSADGNGVRELSRSIQEEVARKTRGILSEWRINKAEKTISGDFSASVTAKVIVLQRSAQMSRMKLAVVSSTKGNLEYSRALQDALSRVLVTSRKFALLDRSNSDVIEQQLSRIKSGSGQLADQVRLTSEVAPDYLVVVRVESVERPDSKLSVSGFLEVIDYSTRQIKFSDKRPIILDPQKPNSLTSRIDVLARMLSRSVLETVYPPTVVSQSDGTITIAQGKDFFSKGDSITLIKLGEVIKDPHTGEYLGRERLEVATGVISFVDARLSQAKLSGQPQLTRDLIGTKSYIVTRVSAGSNGIPDVPGYATRTSRKSKKSEVSSLLDEE